MLKEVAHLDAVETDPRLLLRVRKIIKAITSTVAIDTSYYDNTPASDDTIDGIASLKDPSLITRWYLSDFLKEFYRLMVGWTMEDLNVIANYIQNNFTLKSTEVGKKYDEVYKMPVIKGTKKNLAPEEWIETLLNSISDFKSGSLDVATIRRLYNALDVISVLSDITELGEIDKIYRNLSRTIVSEYGIAAYKDLSDFIAQKTESQPDLSLTKAVENSDSQSLDRSAMINSLFDALNLGDTPTATQLNDLSEKILKYQLLVLKTQKALVEWKRETEMNGYEFKKAQHAKKFEEILNDLSEQDFATIVQGIITQASLKKQDSAAKVSSVSRGDLEGRALKKIEEMHSKIDVGFSSACQSALDAITNALEGIHQQHSVRGAISLLERSSIKSDSGDIAQESFLRYVAASSELVYELLGSTTTEQSADSEVLKSGTLLKIDNAKDHSNASADILLQASKAGPSTSLGYVGIPILSEQKTTIGVASFKIQGDKEVFVSEDVKFIQNATVSLYKLLSRIDARNKAISIAIAAKRYVAYQSEAHIEFYISETLNGLTEYCQVVNAKDLELPAEGTHAKASVTSSPFMMPLTSVLKRIEKKDGS